MQEISPPSPATFTRICRYLRSKSRRIDRGFTLIEITMVIVVIGLGIGGIFVGKDLMRAAEIRSQISQIEQFTVAANTFKLKYNALPGDISPRETAQLGFFTFTGTYAGQTYLTACDASGCSRHGYGNNGGDIEQNEQYPFWTHLVDAKLVTGQYGKAANGTSCLLADTTGSNRLLAGGPASACVAYYPLTKLSTPVSSISIQANLIYTQTKYYVDSPLPNFFEFEATPYQSFTIDTKIDDGLPDKGRVRNGGTKFGAIGATPCVTKTTPNAYDLVTSPDKPGSGGSGYCFLDILW